MGRVLIAVLVAVVAHGCVDHKPYVCSVSSQCVRAGAAGVCEPEGYCSFDDASCESGRRFETGAGDNLGGQCTTATPSCGIPGTPCCAGATCGDNAFCDAGTCTQCVADVALGRFHTCLLKHDGTVWCIGTNETGERGVGSSGGPDVATATMEARELVSGAVIRDATVIGAGRHHACVVRTGGAVWCWGDNTDGQLGNGESGVLAEAAVAVERETGGPLDGMIDVQAGSCHTCALDASGGVWCWGCNDQSELGDGTIVARSRAAPVLTSAGEPFTGAAALSVGAYHACVRTTSDAVWCWGYNAQGQIGDNTLIDAAVPTAVPGFAATSVAAGMFHTCAGQSDGSAWCWGEDDWGLAGNGNVPDDVPTPTRVIVDPGGTPITGVVDVDAGAASCVLTADRRASCWGSNRYGFNGTAAGTEVPMPVLGRDGEPLGGVARIEAHFARTCFHLVGGDIGCVGRNFEGALGDGTFINRGVYTRVTAVSCP